MGIELSENRKKKSGSLRNWIGPFIIIITLIAVLTAGMIDGTLPGAVDAVLHASPVFVILGILSFFLYVFLEASAIRMFLKKEGYHLKLRDGLVATMTSVYYSNITPGASGGQPMQIYQITKSGIPAGIASSAVVSVIICWHFMRALIAGVLVKIYYPFVSENMGPYFYILLLGFAYNIGVVLLYVILSYSKKAEEILVRVVKWGIRVFRIRTDEAKIEKGIRSAVEGFHETMHHLFSDWKFLVREMLMVGASYMFLVWIMYFAYRSISLNSAGFGEMTVMSICQDVSAAYLPTPGASGAQELIFKLYFGKLISGSDCLAVMMIWRFISYYFGLVSGAAVNLLFARRTHDVQKEDA